MLSTAPHSHQGLGHPSHGTQGSPSAGRCAGPRVPCRPLGPSNREAARDFPGASRPSYNEISFVTIHHPCPPPAHRLPPDPPRLPLRPGRSGRRLGLVGPRRPEPPGPPLPAQPSTVAGRPSRFPRGQGLGRGFGCPVPTVTSGPFREFSFREGPHAPRTSGVGLRVSNLPAQRGRGQRPPGSRPARADGNALLAETLGGARERWAGGCVPHHHH